MGKLIFTVEGSTIGTVENGGGSVHTKEVSEQDSSRLIAHFARKYSIDPRSKEGLEAVLDRVFSDWCASMSAEVHEGEKQQAALAAAAAVQPITVT